MIKTLTPYYITTPWTYVPGLDASSYRLEILVWQGHKTDDVPTTNTYEITIYNTTQSSGDSVIDISHLIRDYLDNNIESNVGLTTINPSSPNNSIWVRTQVYYSDNAGVEIDTARHKDTQIAITGYGNGLEGQNPDTPADLVLSDRRVMSLPRGGEIVIPIQRRETAFSNATLIIDTITQLGATTSTQVFFTASGNFEAFYLIATFVSSGATQFINLSGLTSPQLATFLALGEWDVELHGFDLDTNVNITSNTFNITL